VLVSNVVPQINAELARHFRHEEVGLPKRGMKERFGLLRLKADGSPTKVDQVPPMHVLHTDPRFRPEWVDYSALDAKVSSYVCSSCAATAAAAGRPEFQ
jgi:hypothetical protein